MNKPKFPLCSKYGLEVWDNDDLGNIEQEGIDAYDVELALSKAFEDGERTQERVIDVGYEAQKERIAQLEAEVMGLEGCCQVLEKAFGVPKKASLKQIDERIGYFVKLEQELEESNPPDKGDIDGR